MNMYLLHKDILNRSLKNRYYSFYTIAFQRKYHAPRYQDPKTSRWLSTDPALSSYLPTAGGDNSQLPGMGGIYNTVNMHLYHYSANNPVNYVDPDGRLFIMDDLIGATIQSIREGDWEKFGERFQSNFTNSWALFGNMFNTFHNINNFGDFVKGVGELITRLINPFTYIGFLWGYGVIEGLGGKHNTYGNMSIVTAADPNGNGFAYTPGYVCIAPDRIMKDAVWLAHESGHYNISLFTSLFYLVHGLDSIFGASKAPVYYDYRSEVLADKFGGVKRDKRNNRVVP